MSENPYRLAKDIRGIGFRTADAIASRLGIEKTAMVRVRAGISYALTEALNEGHCGLPVKELSALAEKLLEVPSPLIETAMGLELAEKTVIKDLVEEIDCVFLAGLYQAEKGIAERILRLAAGKPNWPQIDADRAIGWLATSSPLMLADSQKQAVELALRSKVLGHHRRAGRWQNHDCEFDPAHTEGKACADASLRSDRARRQAHERGDGAGGKNHPSAA